MMSKAKWLVTTGGAWRRAGALLLTGLSGLALASATAQEIPIDTSQATVRLTGDLVRVRRITVPGSGTFDVDFKWDGAGSFRFMVGTPSAETGGGGTSPTPGGALRNCTVNTPEATYEFVIYDKRMDLTLTPSGNGFLFPPFGNIVQGGNFGEFAKGPYESVAFAWAAPNGFTNGIVPPGIKLQGTLTWVESAWFDPTAPFDLILVGGSGGTC